MYSLEDFFSPREDKVETLIIDGNNLAARANYMEPDLRSPDGRKTGICFLSIRMIKSLINRFEPKDIIIVFDKGWSKRRLEIYPEYKANRKDENKTEEEIKNKQEYIEQIKNLQKYIDLLPLKQIKIKSTEADDIIAYLLNKYSSLDKSSSTILISTDTDFYQFVSSGIKIFNPSKNEFITEEFIKNQLGINAKDYLLYKSLLGDSTDNIEAIKGFGKKAAVSILEKGCDSLDDVLEIAKKTKGKKFEDLVKGFDKIRRNYKLIDLLTDYLDENTKIEIEKQLNEEKVFDSKIFEICKNDGINWDENFFKEIKNDRFLSRTKE